jgi:hypothetical protein
MVMNENFQVPVTLMKKFPNMMKLYFGETLVKAWLGFEPDTGSMEVMIPMYAELPVGTLLEDGEILPNGKYRRSRVVPLLLTDKANVITKNFVNYESQEFVW